MFRKATLSAVAALMLSSMAFAAVDREKDKSADDKEKAKVEAAASEKKVDSARVLRTIEQVKKRAQDLVDAAAKDPKCVGKCQTNFQALQKVVNEKGSLGLGDTVKPEETVLAIAKLIKAGKSPSEAQDEVFGKMGVKEDKLRDCAGL